MDLIKNKARLEDELYMREALAEAEKAAKMDEVPVGAVIVKNGEIIARAHNLVEANKRAHGHAEIVAIDRAMEKLGAKWLNGCSLYVTLEPCAMCAGAMVLARIDRLCIGAMDPKNGACGTIFNVACNERLNHRIEIDSGILEEECSEILTAFFRDMRLRKSALRRKKNTSEDTD